MLDGAKNPTASDDNEHQSNKERRTESRRSSSWKFASQSLSFEVLKGIRASRSGNIWTGGESARLIKMIMFSVIIRSRFLVFRKSQVTTVI